jgi:predicted DNA-binding transcriptional regulator YafY
VLPPTTRAEVERMPITAPGAGLDPEVARRLQTLREATQHRNTLCLTYLDLREQASDREVWPLGCFYWGAVWTLAAWCETREAFRSFRVDRIQAICPTGNRFPIQAGRTLADLLRQEQAQRATGPRALQKPLTSPMY